MSTEKTQQTISRLVKDFFDDDNQELFKRHGWEWQGNQSMNARAKLIKDAYGSIANFDKICQDNGDFGPITNQILGEKPNLILSRFDAWQPEIYGCDWFDRKSDADHFQQSTKPGLISLAMVGDDLVGAYQLTHNRGDISDFSSDKKDTAYAFKAYRAWEFSKPYMQANGLFPRAFKQYQDGKKEAVSVTDDEAQNLLKLTWKITDIYQAIEPISTNPGDPFENNPSIRITAFEGFHPPSWGCVGFGSEATLKRLKKETTDPFIMAIWVTEKALGAEERIKGKVVGFYELSHTTGVRSQFIHPRQDADHEKGKWEYSFQATRAWELLPEFQLPLKEICPEIVSGNRQRTAAKSSEAMIQKDIDRLTSLPRREVKVYAQPHEVSGDIIVTSTRSGKGYVRGGAGRKSGYMVGEPKHTEKELYILKLKGDTAAFLGKDANEKHIYKVGLSVSPMIRCDRFNASMPNGAFEWELFKTTRQDGELPYPNFETSEAGEMVMKKYLGENPGQIENHLGGEFYLASNKMIDEAWEAGRQAALEKVKETENG